MKTILITAYAVNPFKGSEDGTGWHISREIAKTNKVILFTRENNLPHIEKYILENPDDAVLKNMSFHGYDLPLWARWWKKLIGERGYVLYYYLWQLCIAFHIKRKKMKFDLCHCLNFHSDSHPHFLWILKKPVFWGPIGHHPKMKKTYIRHTSIGNRIKDRTYAAVKWMMRTLDPFYRIAVKKSEHVFAINSETYPVKKLDDSRYTVLPAVASTPSSLKRISNPNCFQVLSVGRLHYIKGFDIALEAFTKFRQKNPEINTVFTIVGDGPEKEHLQNLAQKLGISKNVNWIEWVDKSKIDSFYARADVFLFPSHEGAGMVVPEALSFGLPVVCLDNAGPGELIGEAGIKVSNESRSESINDLAKALNKIYMDPALKQKLSELALERHSALYTWSAKRNVINEAYNKALARSEEKNEVVAIFHPSSELYGADRIMVNAINALPEKTKKVVYLKSYGPLKEYIEHNSTNTEVKIIPEMPIIYRRIFSFRGILGLLGDWYRYRNYIKTEHAKYQFKSAYVNTLSCVFILPILRRLGISNYVHVHEIIDSPKLVGYATAKMCKWYAGKIICVSQSVADNMFRYDKKLDRKTLVLHNGISPIKIQNIKKAEGMTFYLFGRIMPKKGQWYLIEALRLIPKEHLKKARFVLMGGAVPGQEFFLDQLNEEIEKADLGQFVQVKSFEKDISIPMSHADVCLVPSLMKDPFPTTVLEAMSAGKTVVATNHGGASEAIVNGVSGFLIPPNKPQAMAKLIEFLITHDEVVSEVGIEARKRYESTFTLEHFNAKWLNLLRTFRYV